VADRDDSEALATARGQTEAMQRLAAEVKGLRRSGRRTWKFVLVDIALTVLLAAIGFLAVHAGQSASSAGESARDAQAATSALRAAAVVSCQQTNTAREQNEQLWAYILTLFGPRPDETAAQKAQGEKVLATLRAKVGTTFAPRDCAALLKGKP
jgi:hypothetical protein